MTDHPDARAELRPHMLTDGLRVVVNLERSRGAWLYDDLGQRELLDFFSCFATVPLGYNHPDLTSEEFLARIAPAASNKISNSDLYTPELAAFVKSFVTTLPPELRGHLFFIEGGALAVENALKAAFDWKCRKNEAAGHSARGDMVIHFREAFHGRSGYTLSLTNTADPRKTMLYPKFDWPRVSNPKLRFPVTAEVESEVAAAEARAVAEIEAAVAEHGPRIAALIIEPIQGEGGDNHFRGAFFKRLRRLADEHEFMLIFDEVQTGFGTTGKWWCFEHFGVVPDVLCFGKKTQVCGIAASARFDEVDSVFHVSSRINSTWGGNLADMVRCRQVVETVTREAVLDNAAAVGARLLAGLGELEQAHPALVSGSRGRGMMLAFDLPDAQRRDDCLKRLLNEAGVLALAAGNRTIRLRPTLTMTAAEADEGIARIGATLEAL